MTTITVRTTVDSEFARVSKYVLDKTELVVRGYNKADGLLFSTRPFVMGLTTKPSPHKEAVTLTTNVRDRVVTKLALKAVDKTGANFGFCRQATLEGFKFTVGPSFALALNLNTIHAGQEEFGEDPRDLIWVTGGQIERVSATMALTMGEATSTEDSTRCSCVVQ